MKYTPYNEHLLRNMEDMIRTAMENEITEIICNGGIVSTSTTTNMIQKPRKNLTPPQRMKAFHFAQNIINAQTIK